MGYQTTSGRWANSHDLTIHASAARTATGTSSAQEVGDRGTARLTLAVTAASGTSPTLDVTMQTSADNSTWRSLGAFAQKTAAGSERLSFSGVDRYIRASYAIGGTTPSLTFSITGDAV